MPTACRPSASGMTTAACSSIPIRPTHSVRPAVPRARHPDDLPGIALHTAPAESIVEATGQQPPVPEALADLEHQQRYVRMPADAALLKAYVAART